jgi:hypothetical protein
MLEPYYRINQAVGISITMLQNGNSLINACGVVVKDNQLNIEKKVIESETVEELSKHFPAKSSIALSLFGKGVLQKQVEKIEEIDQNNFAQILPNANFDDFYIQNFVSGNKSFVSIIRKTEADKWIGLIKHQGFIPLILSLGPFPAKNILPQLNIYNGEVVFDGHVIQRNEQSEWIGYNYKESVSAPFPLKIESEAINEKLIIAYTIAFQLVLAAKINVIKANVNSLETAFQNTISAKKLRVKSFIILITFFALLLVNFFVFSWLNTSNTKLVDKVSLSAQSTNDIQGISDQVKSKESLLKNLGWDGGINKSVLMDQLASLLPADVSWSEITINPLDQSTSRIQKTLQFMDGKIKVIGTSERIIPVNEWIARAKTLKWVKNIQLDSYIYNTELNTGQFMVIIDY